MREHIANDTSDKGLISKIYMELTKLNTKNQTTQLKNGQRASINTSPKRTYRWPIDIWKDAQCHYSSEKCKLKPQWDITSHLSEWPSSVNQKQVLVRMWRKGNLHALLVGMQTGAATVENSTELHQKIKNGSAFWPSDPASGNISEENKNTNSKRHMLPIAPLCSL